MKGNPDRCCFLCATPSGVCATKYACDHHKEAAAALNRSRPPHRDPTGEQAVGNVMRERKRKKRKER